MKQKLFTFLFLAAAALTSCNKDRVYPNIKEYDQQQIDQYIQANGLTGMKRDTVDGDTTGMYYQVLEQGTGDRIQYSDRPAVVFTLRSFDGKYSSTDTIANHLGGYLGQYSTLGLPKGLQIAIYNLVKYKGTAIRLLIPSRLAYGINGTGSGSSSNPNRIAGNQCLDYFIRVVDNLEAYDELSIQKYATANNINIAEYTKSDKGFYYKLSGLDTGDVVTQNSSVSATYKQLFLNNTVLYETTSTSSLYIEDQPKGVQEGLKLTKTGQSLSLLVPSRLAYGPIGLSGIPAFSSLRYEFNVTGVTYY